MNDRKLHIISFDYPFPPNYGGVIDVYHKIRALSGLGIAIHLHSFIKGSPLLEQHPQDDLQSLCEEIHLYPRITHWRKAISTEPYIIRSRSSDTLMKRLEALNAPILLEGMHSMAALQGSLHKKRHTLLRMHNIEWEYYTALAAATDSWWQKAYFHIEAYRLKLQATQLHKANRLLAISESDVVKLKKYHSAVEWLPPFHGHAELEDIKEPGTYALYHGNMTVAENCRAVEFLLEEVFDKLDIPLVIAGQQPPQHWCDRFKERAVFHWDPSADQMNELIRHAQCHVLPTFQATGVKLKLIHALYSGRKCVVNTAMVQGTGLEHLCDIADEPEAMRTAIQKAMLSNLSDQQRSDRSAALNNYYNDNLNAAKLAKWLFED